MRAGQDAKPLRVILAVVGLDEHEVGSLTVSRLLSDAGMEVIYLGRFNTPETVTSAAVNEDADIVGISCHSWEYLEFADDLVQRLAPHGIALVFGGSVITDEDATTLRAKGVAEVYGARSTPEEIIQGISALGAGGGRRSDSVS